MDALPPAARVPAGERAALELLAFEHRTRTALVAERHELGKTLNAIAGSPRLEGRAALARPEGSRPERGRPRAGSPSSPARRSSLPRGLERVPGSTARAYQARRRSPRRRPSGGRHVARPGARRPTRTSRNPRAARARSRPGAARRSDAVRARGGGRRGAPAASAASASRAAAPRAPKCAVKYRRSDSANHAAARGSRRALWLYAWTTRAAPTRRSVPPSAAEPPLPVVLLVVERVALVERPDAVERPPRDVATSAPESAVTRGRLAPVRPRRAARSARRTAAPEDGRPTPRAFEPAPGEARRGGSSPGGRWSVSPSSRKNAGPAADEAPGAAAAPQSAVERARPEDEVGVREEEHVARAATAARVQAAREAEVAARRRARGRPRARATRASSASPRVHDGDRLEREARAAAPCRRLSNARAASAAER